MRLLLASLTAAHATRAAAKPNVLLVLADDLDALLTDAPLYLPRTHSLIAGAGLELTNAFAHTPICCPSRAQLMTGRYFHNVRVPAFDSPGGCMHVASDDPDFYAAWHFATHFAAGYAVGIFGKHLNNDNPVDAPEGVDRWLVNGGGDYLDPAFSWAPGPNASGASVTFDNCTGHCYSTSVIGNATLRWWADRSDDARPFFAYVSVKAPHIQDGDGWPVAIPAPWYNSSSIYPADAPPRTPSWNASCPDHHWLVASQPPMTAEQADRSDELFRTRLRSLLSVDDLVEALVGDLDRRGALDDTFVVFTSDHGFQFGQFRMPEGKWNVYDHDVRVPFYVRGPGIERGTNPTPLTHVDVMPTLLGLVGVATPSTMDGADLSSFLLGGTRGDRATLLLEYVGAGTVVRYQHAEDATNNTFRALRVLDGARDLKYVEFTSSEADWNFTAPPQEYELFDLTADPYEMTNLYAGADPALLASLHAEVVRLYGCRGQEDCASSF